MGFNLIKDLGFAKIRDPVDSQVVRVVVLAVYLGFRVIQDRHLTQTMEATINIVGAQGVRRGKAITHPLCRFGV